MKKNIWIINHYATNMFFDEGGRHYWLGKELTKRGYRVTIFCANIVHKSDTVVKINSGICREKEKDGLRFVFIKTNDYQGNGLSRVENMLMYTINMLRLYRRYGKVNGKPDVIYASSVHPLALYAGIKMAKHYHVKSICEVRDLWPLTLIDFGSIKKDGIIAKLMFWYERKIYEKSDELIFTMEGGKQYIRDKKWDLLQGGKVDLKKVHYINNGTDLKLFYKNRDLYKVEDEDLEDKNSFKIVYTGTLGPANRLDLLLDIAKYLQEKDIPVQCLIWGDGETKAQLLRKIKSEKIRNTVLKGRIPKKYIPYITSNADLNISFLGEWEVFKYGLSKNKMFDYIAAQKNFIIAGAVCKCKILEENPFCTMCGTSDVRQISEAIIDIYNQKQSKYELPLQKIDKLMDVCDFSRRADDLVEILETDRG